MDMVDHLSVMIFMIFIDENISFMHQMFAKMNVSTDVTNWIT